MTVPNSHCQPCVGCTKNCYDFNPRVAYLADLYEDDRHYTGYRRLFVGCSRASSTATSRSPAHITTGGDYGRFALYMGVSAASFFLPETVLKVSVAKIAAVYGAIAISIYYWFAPVTLADTWLHHSTAFLWALRGMVWALAAVWLVRTWLKEKVFVEATQSALSPRRRSVAASRRRARRARPTPR